jgi:hypothetical protein
MGGGGGLVGCHGSEGGIGTGRGGRRAKKSGRLNIKASDSRTSTIMLEGIFKCLDGILGILQKMDYCQNRCNFGTSQCGRRP